MNIPFLDLKTQFREIEHEVLPMVKEAMENAAFIGGPQVFARILPGQLHDAIYLFQVIPPLLFRVGLAITHQIIAPYGQAACQP